MYISNQLTRFLYQNNYIHEKEREIYRYCLNYFFSLLFYFINIQIISILFQHPSCAIIFFLIVIPMRGVCGGYHAPTQKKCSFLSYGAFLLSLFLLPITQKIPTICWIIFFTMSIAIILRLPGITHENRNFSMEQKRKQHFGKQVICTLLSVFFLLTLCLHLKHYFHFITICVMIVLVNLFFARICSYRKGGYSIDF